MAMPTVGSRQQSVTLESGQRGIGEPFTPKEREHRQAAQTEILRQLHDEPDAAVIEAYGWNQEQGNHRFTPMNPDHSFEHQASIGVPRSSSVVKDGFPPAALSDTEILERLVTLNLERAQGGFTAETAKGAEKRQGQASSASSGSSAVKGA